MISPCQCLFLYNGSFPYCCFAPVFPWLHTPDPSAAFFAVLQAILHPDKMAHPDTLRSAECETFPCADKYWSDRNRKFLLHRIAERRIRKRPYSGIKRPDMCFRIDHNTISTIGMPGQCLQKMFHGTSVIRQRKCPKIWCNPPQHRHGNIVRMHDHRRFPRMIYQRWYQRIRQKMCMIPIQIKSTVSGLL